QDFQNKYAELQEKQQSVDKLHSQYSQALANRLTDDTRIFQMTQDPSVPEDPSWPMWDAFVRNGAIAGLVLSIPLAHLLARRYAKKLAAELPPPATLPLTPV
ncbi:MAG TPA: hypothetical protein VGN88_07080, partial [Phycisphaerae bacterium]